MNKLATILRESRLARFLIPAGIMLVAFGIFFFSASKRNQNYVETQATVTSVELEEEAHTDGSGNRVEATYKAGVKYTAGGKEYESELSGVSKYEVGDKVKIYYDPADPNQITMSKSLIIPLIIIAAGIAMLVGGTVSCINAVKRYNKMKAQEEEWANG